MEGIPYKAANRYADVIRTMWFAFFFAKLIPVGIFFSLISLIFYYWVDKYNLLKRCTVKTEVCEDLSAMMITYLEFTLVFFALGSIMTDLLMFENISNLNITILCIVIVYNLLPLEKINEAMFPINR